MRIAFFSWESLHSIAVGGIAAHVSELADSLAKRGHEVHIFTRIGNNQPYYQCVNGVHYHLCQYDWNQDFKEEINNMCRSLYSRFEEVERNSGGFDILHAHDWLTANVLIWLKQSRSTRTVFTMHSTEYGRCGNNFGSAHSEEISGIEWSGIYHSDRVIAVSKTLRHELNWLYSLAEDKVNVVYNGVDFNSFDGWIDDLAVRMMYDIGPQDPIVLFVGRMVYQKGPDILMESLPSVLHQHKNVKFVFAGDGGMRYQVEETARQMGIYHATRFLGSIDGWKLKDLFKTANCVVIPSRNEPFGIVILEAWSAGKPVVASIQGGPSEIVWHDVNGYKVSPKPNDLSWGMGSMIDQTEHAQWMGRNGRLTAETVFSWDQIADETLKIYCN